MNDVVLALVSGVLRKFLADRGELPDNSLVAMVPVSVHEKSNRPGRNQVSGMFSKLETHIEDPAEPGAINIGSGEPRSVGEMAVALAAAFGSAAPRPVVAGEYRLGDVRHVFASSARARDRLGFQARIGFEDGLAEFARAPLRSSRAGWARTAS